MIKLHDLRKHPKSTHRRKVVGRGLGSGHGTYSTRGGKGQTARTGHSKMPIGFEGGRQPLMRQVPKLRGFKSLSNKAVVVALNELKVFTDGEVVTVGSLRTKGLIPASHTGGAKTVKILGSGKLGHKLEVRVPVSAATKAAIEQAGGSVK